MTTKQIHALQPGDRVCSTRMIMLTIKGIPIPKPTRMTRGPLWSRPAQEQQYRAWQQGVRLQATGKVLKNPVMIALIMNFYLPSKPSQRGAIHLIKPDLSNLIKGVEDALFENDARVYQIQARKFYDDGHGCRLELSVIY